VLIVVLGAFGLAKAARQHGEGRKSLAVASGLLLPTLIYFVLWLVGGIAR
jgi:hypothetical protein